MGREEARGSPIRLLMVWAVTAAALASCNRPYRSEGERLARTYCAACHAFPDPQLLDQETWKAGVLPQMGTRLGVGTASVFNDALRSPHMTVLPQPVSDEDWEAIVRYYLERAPATLPAPSLPVQPVIDPEWFGTGPFAPRLPSSGIITVLEIDSVHERIFVGEAGTNTLRVFDWNRRLRSTLTLDSPPTDVIVLRDHVLVLESGVLQPNDQPRGRLVQYAFADHDTLQFRSVLIDSLLRPVFAGQFDFDGDGVNEFLICEFGHNRGRLALYRYAGARYARQVLDTNPGAIRFEVADMTGDGSPDIVALFGQGDERIVLFESDRNGTFGGRSRVLARFPPVYGSMHFSLHDFNGDGHRDILYVNGDNFDYSRVLKPYHGIRILENDGKNRFTERYFFPLYGAAQAVVADFDRDGDLDILATSNFADSARHPERGIVFLAQTAPYEFTSYAFSIAAGNQWNVMAQGDLNGDGWLDAVIGAMDLESIATMQRRMTTQTSPGRRDPILFFENRGSRRAADRATFTVP